MKKIVPIKHIEYVNTPKEYTFPEEPIFYQVWNYRQVIAIYPKFSDKYGLLETGQWGLLTEKNCDYEVFIGKENRCEYFTLTEDHIIELLNETPEKHNIERYENAQVIIGMCSIEDIHEKTFKKYYAKYLETLKLPS